MGDVIHTLPALTEAKSNHAEIRFDWLVEEGFAEIPAFHPAVNRVIEIALRRWRKKWYQWQSWRELFLSLRQLRKVQYDLIIDLQGLLKSALFAKLARGMTIGFDRSSAREWVASCFYRQSFYVNKQQHAIFRIKQLLAESLGYRCHDAIDYGIHADFEIIPPSLKEKTVMLIHGTSREEKEWSLKNWQQLASALIQQGYRIVLPWGSDREYHRAQKIAKVDDRICVLPKMSLRSCAQQLLSVQQVVAVDTGLAHLAAALNCSTVVLYGATNPALIGTIGDRQRHICESQMVGIKVEHVLRSINT